MFGVSTDKHMRCVCSATTVFVDLIKRVIQQVVEQSVLCLHSPHGYF